MARCPGLLDVDDRLRRLSEIGDQLEGRFRAGRSSTRRSGDGAKVGRLPFDPVMMFKIPMIQAQNSLSDNRAEFLINDGERQDGTRHAGIAIPVFRTLDRPGRGEDRPRQPHLQHQTAGLAPPTTRLRMTRPGRAIR